MLFAREEWDPLANDRTKSKEDLYSVLNPITGLCRVLGIFPLWLKGSAGKRKYSASHVLIIYGLIALAVSTTGLFKWIEYMDRVREPILEKRNHGVIMTGFHVEFILQAWSISVIIVSSLITNHEFSNAIYTLSSQDTILHKLGTRLDYTADLRQNCIRLGINVSSTILLFTYNFLYESDINLRNPLIWAAAMYPIAVRIASACLFADVLFAMRQRFAALNEHLSAMIRETEHFSAETVSESGLISKRLCSIARVYDGLYEAALSVNRTLGLNVMTGVVCALEMLTTSMYHITQELNGRIDVNWMRMVIAFLDWGIINSVHIVYIVTACSSTKSQARLTGKLIHKIQTDGGATPFNAAVRSFSLQLHHERIEFSAGGLFPLDAALLQSVVGAVATFLIISIQFQTSVSDATTLRSTNDSLT